MEAQGRAGSRPDLRLARFSFHDRFGAVAQLGERQNRNLEVGGSIPLCSTRKAGNRATNVPGVPIYTAWFDYGRARWGVSGAL